MKIVEKRGACPTCYQQGWVQKGHEASCLIPQERGNKHYQLIETFERFGRYTNRFVYREDAGISYTLVSGACPACLSEGVHSEGHGMCFVPEEMDDTSNFTLVSAWLESDGWKNLFQYNHRNDSW